LSTALKARPKQAARKFPYAALLVLAFCFWLFWESTTVSLPQKATPPTLFANALRQDLHLTFLKAIRNARHSVDLTMFGLSDPPIIAALSQKAKEGVATTIYYDPTASPALHKTIPNGAIMPVHQTGLMHRKMLIIDDATVFLGSANFTTASLKMHDNLVIGMTSPRVAQFLKEKKPHDTGYLRTMVGGQDVELWLLPDPKGRALAELRKQIRQAESSLRVALFTLTHSTLIDELIRAKRRGVKVEVLLDRNAAFGASADAVKALKTGRVQVYSKHSSQGLLHHKFAYIDGKTLIAGSANWTQSAFTKNSDCLITLHHLTQEQKGALDNLWNQMAVASKLL
jgi:phosphatidylserine/phosphatidylglycerophosphate/cardiolipin synthase-like enzyme